MRSFVSKDISPALHRSSYESTTEDGSDDPIKSWKQTCTVLQHSIDELVEEMITKGGSVVIEGVHVIPDNRLIDRWEASGGVATGIVLTVPDEEAHKSLLIRRGAMTGKGERDKLEQFHRIRTIHDEMIRLANEKNWQLVEQNLQPDPLDLVASRLWRGSGGSKLLLDGLSETPPVEPTRSTDVQTEEGLNNNNNDNRLQMSPKT
jgi:2-phosphoglycerate kinase